MREREEDETSSEDEGQVEGAVFDDRFGHGGEPTMATMALTEHDAARMTTSIAMLTRPCALTGAHVVVAAQLWSFPGGRGRHRIVQGLIGHAPHNMPSVNFRALQSNPPDT